MSLQLFDIYFRSPGPNMGLQGLYYIPIPKPVCPPVLDHTSLLMMAFRFLWPANWLGQPTVAALKWANAVAGVDHNIQFLHHGWT